MLTRYDPDRAPEPTRWLATPEDQRLEIIRRFHRKAGIRIPNMTVHVVLHSIVENQVALGDETPVAATLARLMREGLTRHDAIHAVATVLLRHMTALMEDEVPEGEDPNVRYFAELEELTADAWLASAE
ncbi:MAG TPA: hypothetical protein VF092_04155 [Longimicrobium sp.]